MEQKILKTVEETNLNVTEIAKLYNVNREEVIRILIQNEYYEFLDNPNARLPTTKRLRKASLYFINNDTAYSNVAKMFGVRKIRLKEYLEKWYPSKQIIKSNYNEHIFDEIDTEEKAYWLGFLFADGYINSGPLNGEFSYKFELTLADKDIDHLRKFANFIGYNKSISKKVCKRNNKEYKAVRISISSKHLWNTLNNLGCTPRKSLTLRFPEESIFKEKSLIRHFIRGYFDGDGTLGVYDYKVGEYTYHDKCVCSILGTKAFLERLKEFFKFDKTIKSAGSKNYPNNAFRITYTCKQALEVSTILYKDSKIYLDRKYLKYLEFCRLYEESYRELQTKIGEDCDVNPEVITETKESVTP